MRSPSSDPQDPEAPARGIPHQAGKVQCQGVTRRIRKLHRRDRWHFRNHERLEVVTLRFITSDLYRARIEEILTGDMSRAKRRPRPGRRLGRKNEAWFPIQRGGSPGRSRPGSVGPSKQHGRPFRGQSRGLLPPEPSLSQGGPLSRCAQGDRRRSHQAGGRTPHGCSKTRQLQLPPKRADGEVPLISSPYRRASRRGGHSLSRS